MVYRVFVEKKKELANEAKALCADARAFLGIKSLSGVRIFNRYDAENISKNLFDYAVKTVFSEPVPDITCEEPDYGDARVFAVEYLPGQFDQRADSAAQCIQIISQGERPTVRSAKVYALYGDLSEAEINDIKKYVINPVESREAALEKPKTLAVKYDIPKRVETVKGFTRLGKNGLAAFIKDRGLAMDEGDIAFCQSYFRKEGRDPTITEIKLIDTYWSDHCRHTTFGTMIDKAEFADAEVEKAFRHYLEVRKELGRENKPVCLMDIATIAAKELKQRSAEQARRIGRDKRLHGEDRDRSRRRKGTLAAAVQERNAQPPHRNRAVRRRGDLHRRRDTRPAFRQGVRLRRDARHRRGGPA